MVDDDQTGGGRPSGTARWVAPFRAALPPGVDRSGWPDERLAAVLQAACARAASAWPALALPDEVLVAHLAGRVGPGVTEPEQILELALVELALAAACLHGRAGAV